MSELSLRRHASIKDVKGAWASIIANNIQKSLFDDYDLIEAWYECFLAENTMCLFSIWKGEECIGILPMMIQKKFGATIVNTLYVNSASICHPITRDEYRESIVKIFMDLFEKSNFRWDAIKFSELYTYDSCHKQVLEFISTKSSPGCHVFSEPTYCVDFGITMDQYFKEYISKGSLKDYKRKSNRLKRLQDHHAVFLHDQAALDKLHVFLEIENTGWKNEMGVSTLSAPKELTYAKSLFQAASRHGAFFLALLYVGDVAIAGHCGYVHENVYYLVKTAYRNSYSFYSPSVILFMDSIKYLIESCPEITRLNFFPKSFGYKHKYAHDSYRCDTFVISNKAFLSRLFFSLYKLKMKRNGNGDRWKFMTSKHALEHIRSQESGVFRFFRS